MFESGRVRVVVTCNPSSCSSLRRRRRSHGTSLSIFFYVAHITLFKSKPYSFVLLISVVKTLEQIYTSYDYVFLTILAFIIIICRFVLQDFSHML